MFCLRIKNKDLDDICESTNCFALNVSTSFATEFSSLCKSLPLSTHRLLELQKELLATKYSRYQKKRYLCTSFFDIWKRVVGTRTDLDTVFEFLRMLIDSELGL